MKIIKATLFASLLFGSLAAQAGQPIINLSVGGELAPGVYGQVEFGNAPPPPVVYQETRIIVRDPRMVHVEPLYLHVPPGHAKHWRKHCREYDACNRPVYFVRSEEYEPGYLERSRMREHDDEHEHHGYEGDQHNTYSDGDRGDDDEGHGRGHGKKHKKHKDKDED